MPGAKEQNSKGGRTCHKQDNQKAEKDPKRQKWYHSEHHSLHYRSQLHHSHEDGDHAPVQQEHWTRSANDDDGDDDDGDDGVNDDVQDDQNSSRRLQPQVELEVV